MKSIRNIGLLALLATGILNYSTYAFFDDSFNDMFNRMEKRMEQMRIQMKEVIKSDHSTTMPKLFVHSDDQQIIVEVPLNKDSLEKVVEDLKIIRSTTGSSDRVKVTLPLGQETLELEISPTALTMYTKKETEEKREEKEKQSSFFSFSSSSYVQTIPTVSLENVQATIDEKEAKLMLTLSKKHPTITQAIPVTRK